MTPASNRWLSTGVTLGIVTAAPKPGWYLDPAGARDRTGSPRYRWWDGSGWTDALGDSAQAPAPTGRLRPQSHSAGRMRKALVLSIGFVVFLGASLGAAALLWREPSSTSAARPAAPTTANPTGHLDLQTRMAIVGRASMQLPDHPYALSPDPLELRGIFDVLFLATAPVHPRYDGHRSWSSAVLLGRLSSDLGPGDDLEALAQIALKRFSRAFFAGHRTSMTDLSSWDQAVSGCPGLRISARVNYSAHQLPSRFDTVTATLVRQDDGSVAVAVSSIPDDAGPQLTAQAAEALASLAIR